MKIISNLWMSWKYFDQWMYNVLRRPEFIIKQSWKTTRFRVLIFSLCSQMKKRFFILCLDFSSYHMDHYSYIVQVHPYCRQDGVSNGLWYKTGCCVYCDSEDIKCPHSCILLESLIIQWKNLEILVKWATQNRLTQPETMAFPQLLSSKNMWMNIEKGKSKIY